MAQNSVLAVACPSSSCLALLDSTSEHRLYSSSSNWFAIGDTFRCMFGSVTLGYTQDAVGAGSASHYMVQNSVLAVAYRL